MSKENKEIVKTATEALKILWKEGFFQGAGTINDTVKELSKKGYNFPLTNVVKALQRAPYLTQKGKRGNYKYIQKYPYIRESLGTKSKYGERAKK